MKIYCNKCNQIIGEISVDENNRVTYIQERPLISDRFRMDNNWGFQCDACKSDSLRCEAEKDVITSRRPTTKQINQILDEIRKNPTIVIETDEYTEVDGFRMLKEG